MAIAHNFTVYETAMWRALELAHNGPEHDINPHVGCVVLDPNGHIIAEGWHRGSGTDHAEIDALKKLTPEQAKGSTFVVTLEPCNHVGQTGPCATALINAQVGTVVYSVSDPGDESSGGAKELRQAGIEVVAGVREEEVTEFLRPWLISATNHRPFVTVKWASSLDGRAAAEDGTSQWISSAQSRTQVHHQREHADAIVVGTGTVLADNPALTARKPSGELAEHQPIPVIFGSRDIPKDFAVHSHPHKPIVLRSRDLKAGLSELYDHGIRSVYVEGGPTLISSFIQENLVDRYFIFLAPTLLGGSKVALSDLGVTTLSERVNLRIDSVRHLGDDLLITARPALKEAH